MEVFLGVLFGLLGVGLVLIGPILGIVGFVRGRGLRNEIRELRQRLDGAEARLAVLARREAAAPPPAREPVVGCLLYTSPSPRDS